MTKPDFTDTLEYHTVRMQQPQEPGSFSRDALVDALAYHLFGKGMDERNPVGSDLLRTTGRDLVAPLADAVMSCPGITFTPPDEEPNP